MGQGTGEINTSTTSIKAQITAFHDKVNTTDLREIDGADMVDVEIETTRNGTTTKETVSMTVDQYLRNGSNGDSKNVLLVAARRDYEGIDYSKGMRARLFK